MAAPPVPPALEPLQGRTFAFYPPIRNVEHNEWELRKVEWSEMLVANARDQSEVWIPRRYVGKVSSVDQPLMIVGLDRELEYKGGSVWPYQPRLVQMPASAAVEMPRPASSEPAPRSHLESIAQPTPEARASRLIIASLLLVVAVSAAVFIVLRLNAMRPVKLTAVDQEFLTLHRDDDYFSVVRKLGPPAESRWKPQSGELSYQALWYPQRAYYVILLGTDRNDARYIGAVDKNWHVVHALDLPRGGNTASILRSLGKF